MILPLPFGQWQTTETQGDKTLAIRFQRAWHTLGFGAGRLPCRSP